MISKAGRFVNEDDKVMCLKLRSLRRIISHIIILYLIDSEKVSPRAEAISVATKGLSNSNSFFFLFFYSKVYCRTDKNFLLIRNQTEFRVVHNQKTIVSAITFLSIWKKIEIQFSQRICAL